MMKKFQSLLFLVLCACFMTAQAQIETLPKNLIALNSPEGQKLFIESDINQDFWRLSNFYVTQKTLTYCGVATSAMILNALSINAPISPSFSPFQLFTQENIFTQKVLKIISPTQINVNGIDLDTLAELLRAFPVHVTTVHSDEVNFERFHRDLIKSLEDPKAYVLVNIDRKALNQIGYGHISPVAAYNKKADAFLFMDVARYKYPPTWIKAETLWRATNTREIETNRSRGYLIVKKM